MREKELRAAKAQLQKRDLNAPRAAEAEAALAAAKAEVRAALLQLVVPFVSHWTQERSTSEHSICCRLRCVMS